MNDRRLVRAGRRPMIIDLILSVAICSLLMAGVREALTSELGRAHRLLSVLVLFAMASLAVLYGVSSAFEFRRGWTQTSFLSGFTHLVLAFGSVFGIGVLCLANPMAAVMGIASVGLILLWSVTWA